MRHVLHVFSGIKSAQTQVKFFTDFFEMIEANDVFHNNMKFTFYIDTNDMFIQSLEDFAKDKKMVIQNYTSTSLLSKDILNNEHLFDKIIFHQFPSYKLVLKLLLKKYIINKAVWYTWGGDFSQKTNVNFWKPKSFIYENIIKRYFIYNLQGISCWNKYDYITIKKVYGTKAEFMSAIYMPNLDFSKFNVTSKKSHNIKILVGNNAQSSNNHVFIFNQLKKFKDENIEVYCPLSYGSTDEKYINKVIKKGREYFGDRFFPLVDYMSFMDYIEFLKDINIVVFYQFRQQGGANIWYSLLFGAKLYLNPTSSSFLHFSDMGIKVFDSSSIKNKSFRDFVDFPVDIQKKNNKLLKSSLKKEKIINDWINVFEK